MEFLKLILKPTAQILLRTYSHHRFDHIIHKIACGAAEIMSGIPYQCDGAAGKVVNYRDIGNVFAVQPPFFIEAGGQSHAESRFHHLSAHGIVAFRRYIAVKARLFKKLVAIVAEAGGFGQYYKCFVFGIGKADGFSLG